MVTISQIKAARALLDWTQRDLAKISGISLAAIAQIESGAGNPRAETMNTLRQAFEKYDIEFTDDPGVRIRREPFGVNVWQGSEAILKIWRDIESVFADGKGGEVLLSGFDDPMWEKILPNELPQMVPRRNDLGIVTKGLVRKREDNRTLPPELCRVMPQAISSEAPYYVYADRIAIIKLVDPIRVIHITNPTLAQSFRAQFQYHWDNGKKL